MEEWISSILSYEIYKQKNIYVNIGSYLHRT
jgi:hypothetical protein